MLDADHLTALVDELDEAEQSQHQVELFSRRFPEMTIDDGYRIQQAWVAKKLERGRSLKGHKIGLTSRAMQMAAQITEPDFGALLDDMFFAEGGELPTDRFIVPRVEVELGFVLSRDLCGPEVEISDVLDAVEYVIPAVEIIDARIEQVCRHTGSPRSVVDTISDNAANAGVVPGGRRVKPDDVDMRWCGALLTKNDIIEETGISAGVLGHPANGVVWLTNKLARHGELLRSGEFVLSGSFTRPVPAAKGDVFFIDYGRLGSIKFRFA